MGRLLQRRARRADGIQWKLVGPQWIDPFPWVNGSVPEKMVYAELVRRGIFFYNQVPITTLVPAVRGAPVLAMSPYVADFALPGVKIILDPWDDYHHSLPDQARADAIKLAVYQALGWKTYHVWASDLMRYGVGWWFMQIPELGSDKLQYGAPQIVQAGRHDTAGIAAANASRRKFKAPTLKRRARRGRRQLT